MEAVYETLWGLRIPDAAVEGVENLFAAGEECERLYDRMLDAYERLRNRLGMEDEDEDVEIIISSLLGIDRAVSYKMYEYGAKFGMDRQ